ncbi:Uncharacterized protein OBRU01_03374 [Operophtera brumata]|uniref:P/Homo B domain-containing protein n=1 Tax=Operophtera brumata TaxID=104452 RepID=A0A0L7LI55_OPEBR|nr:Uncharacterized protein OBRU01_03374 [Operophtera brumata]
MNGVGLEFNHLFGFGVLDAGAMTALAANWRSVPPRYHCEAGAVNTHMEVPTEGTIKLTIDTSACAGTPSEVRYLEHVQAVVSANATRRGDLELFLTSPMGTNPDSWRGFVRGWSLVLHGTRSAPYAQLEPQDPHSKLAVVKKAHEDNAAIK